MSDTEAYQRAYNRPFFASGLYKDNPNETKTVSTPDGVFIVSKRLYSLDESGYVLVVHKADGMSLDFGILPSNTSEFMLIRILNAYHKGMDIGIDVGAHNVQNKIKKALGL